MGNETNYSIWPPFVGGLISALGLVAIIIFLGHRAGYISDFSVFQREREKSLEIPSEDVVAALQFAEPVIAALQKAKQRLDVDAGSIPDTSSKFMPFSEVFPSLWDNIPRRSRPLFALRIRKQEQAYKILVFSSACPVIVAAGKVAKDPIREPVGYQTLCSHFAVWNEAGKDF